MSDVTRNVTRPLAVLSETENGFTKEVNMVAWNDGEEKLDIRGWYAGHERCTKGVTLTADEGRKLFEALRKLYK